MKRNSDDHWATSLVPTDTSAGDDVIPGAYNSTDEHTCQVCLCVSVCQCVLVSIGRLMYLRLIIWLSICDICASRPCWGMCDEVHVVCLLTPLLQ